MRSVVSLLFFAALCLPVEADDPIEPKGTQTKGAELATAILNAGLDAEACYRVRDVSFSREELRFYLTDGYLILGRPVHGRIYSAAFLADHESGDAEVIVIPPTRSERASLARFTQTPNLDEHISAAVFLFSDGTGKELLEQIQAGAGKPAPEKGAIMVADWNDVVRNLSGSLATRILHDSFSNNSAGIFYSAATGRKLGNFDLIFDPQAREQITVGQVVFREERNFFDVWTNFTARAYRTGRKQFYRDGIVLSDFRIEAELQPDLMMNAVTRMKMTASEAAGVVSLDLSQRMRVASALIDGRPVEVLARDSLRSDLLRGSGNGTVLLVFDEPLQPGRTYELEVRHSGSVVVPAGNGVFFVGARTSWYPTHGTAFARYDMTFRYPRTVNLVANGDIGEDTVDGEWRITKRRTSGPIRFAGFNLGDYVEASIERAGCTIRVYANRKLESSLGQRSQQMAISPAPWPRDPRVAEILAMPSTQMAPSPANRVQQLAQEIGGAYEFMVGHFGPGPLKTLTVSPIPGTFGQGFPGLLYISTLSYMDPKDRPDEARAEIEQMFYSDILHSHETAHQWWGNLVTSASHEDDWLMEAVANYSALMYLEKRKGRRALDSVLDLYRTHLLEEVKDAGTVESAGPISWGLRLNTSRLPGAWRIITYEKGSWILHMIRAQMGDQAFLKMLGQLAVRYRYQTVSTQQFRQLAQEFMPAGFPDRSLESFFEQWVYGTGVPKVSLIAKWSGKAPAVKVRGTLSQQGVDEDFSAMVPVEIQLPNKRSVTKWVRSSSEPVEFIVPTKAAPSKVLLDPGNNILRR